LTLLDAVDHGLSGSNSRRDGRLEAHLQHVLNVFGDFLEIFSKWYGATIPSLFDKTTVVTVMAAVSPATGLSGLTGSSRKPTGGPGPYVLPQWASAARPSMTVQFTMTGAML
jgi:hypothetical protein